MLAMVLPFTPTAANTGPTNWAALLKRAQGGDKLAYSQFLRECLPWIEQQARRMISIDMVDDVAQEALLAIHRVLHTYDATRPLNAWLFGIVRFKSKEAWRKTQRHQHDELHEDFAHTEVDCTATNDVNSLLSSLPQSHANVVRLTKLDGLSMEEAAAATGQSVSWVKVTVHRALKKLSKAVKTDE